MKAAAAPKYGHDVNKARALKLPCTFPLLADVTLRFTLCPLFVHKCIAVQN